MYARVSSTRSSVLVVLLGNAQQYYLFRWGEVIIHLKLEKVAPSTFFFFFFLFGESIYHPPLILMKGKATPPVLYPPTSPKVSGRLDARSKISTFSHHLFPGGDACSNTFRVPFLFAVCVCVCVWISNHRCGRLEPKTDGGIRLLPIFLRLDRCD